MSAVRDLEVIFVPAGQSPEQVWERLSRGLLVDADQHTPGGWRTVEVEGLTTRQDGDYQRVTGGRLVRVYPAGGGGGTDGQSQRGDS